MKSFKQLTKCSLSIAIAAASGMVSAVESTLNEVMVNAQRRAEVSQDVPITINTLDADLLSDAGVSQLTDISELTPGLRFDASSAFVQPSIRGVGNAVVSPGSTSNVGIYVDGFYVPNPLAVDFQLMSLESVQILKGPQGTLFGRNTTGGAILVNTSKPSSETRGTLEASYGSYNEKHVGFYGTTGLTENVAMDVEGTWESGDGYWDNIITGNDDDAEFDNWSGRIGLAWDISDKASLLLRYTHHDVDDGRSVAYNVAKIDGQFLVSLPTSLFTGDPDKISVELPIGFTSESDIYQATFRYDMGFATLTSYTQYREDESHVLIDNDGSGVTVAQLDINPKDETFTQEFLLTSNSDGPLQWTAGLFYMDYTDDYIPFKGIIPAFGIVDDFAVVGGSTTTIESLAAYLDATYQLTDGLYVTLGYRVGRDDNTDSEAYNFFFPDPTINGPVPVDDYKDTEETARAVVRYELDDNSSVYLSYTEGYKAGFLDVPNPPPADRIKPEQIEAYELGYKYAGERVSLEIAYFDYDYQNLQVSRYPEGTAITVNADSASINGIDAQLRFSPTESLQLMAAGTWLDAEYDDFPDYFKYLFDSGTGLWGNIDQDVSGQTMQRAPKFTGTLSAKYEMELADGVLALSGNLYYTSKYYFDADETLEEPSYTTVGLRAAWTDPSQRYTVALYGNNVTDEEYRAAVNETFSGPTAVWAAPATYGASVKVNF